MSVSGYTAKISSTDTYTPGDTTHNVYWGVFPVVTRSDVTSKKDALACTATFVWKDATGYSRTILTLSHSSAAGSR